MPNAAFYRLKNQGIRCKGGARAGCCAHAATWYAEYTLPGRSFRTGKNVCDAHAARIAHIHGGGTINLDQFKEPPP